MRYKKFIVLILSCLVLVGMVPSVKVNAASKSAYAFYEYDETTGTGKLTFSYNENKSSKVKSLGEENVFDVVKDITSEEQVPWANIKDKVTTVRFGESFKDYKPTSTQYWFKDFTALTTIEQPKYLTTSAITKMDYMFMGCNNLKSINVSSWNKSSTVTLTSISNMFNGCSNLTEITGLANWKTSMITDMSYLFYGCTIITAPDIAGWDVSQVTDMSYMFANCAYFKTLDFSKWCTSNVTNMEGMFCNSGLSDASSISGFDVSKVTNMNSMFQECGKLKEADLSAWDTSNVENMSEMFWKCKNMTTLKTTGWNVRQVTDMGNMFNECNALETIDLSDWETDNLITMEMMFYKCAALKSVDLSVMNTEKVTDMSYLFGYCTALQSVNISNLNTDSLTEINGMFYNCPNLTSVNFTGFDTKNVKCMDYLFGYCTKLSMDFSVLDTHNVQSMLNMFIGCTFTELDLSSWDTSNLRNASGMFEKCTNVKKLNLKGFCTSGVTNITEMFADCNNLTDLNVSDWDTSNVSTMKYLFSNCMNLKELDLSGWNVQNVNSFYGMFYKCVYLKDLDLSGLKNSQAENFREMFYNCANLKVLDLSGFDFSNSQEGYLMFNGCNSLETIYVSQDWEQPFIYERIITNGELSVFSNCLKLVGGNGTVYDSTHINADYFCIDRPDRPGYLTLYENVNVSYEGGTGAVGTAPDTTSVLVRSDIVLPQNTFVRTGYTFVGWTDGKNTYQPGSTFKVVGNVVFKAVWILGTPTAAPTPTDVPGGNGGNGNNGSGSGNNGSSGNTTPGNNSGNGSTGGNGGSGSGTGNNPIAPTTPIPTAAPAPTLAPSELNVGDFVRRCYQVALQREAEAEGFEYWVSKLNNGEACGAQVGFGFIFSGEYTNRNRNDDEFVRDLYSMYFDREPDQGGYDYWIGLLAAGSSREDVFAGFANSQEFYNLCLKYGVTQGYYVTHMDLTQQGGVNCFVARLYKVCLNRLPDMGGQSGWVVKLINGEVTGTTAAYGFIMSPEFTNLGLNDVDYVAYMYRAFFGREAAKEEIDGWVMNMASGLSREDVFNGFSGSLEFDELCNSYGIMR